MVGPADRRYIIVASAEESGDRHQWFHVIMHYISVSSCEFSYDPNDKRPDSHEATESDHGPIIRLDIEYAIETFRVSRCSARGYSLPDSNKRTCLLRIQVYGVLCACDWNPSRPSRCPPCWQQQHACPARYRSRGWSDSLFEYSAMWMDRYR